MKILVPTVPKGHAHVYQMFTIRVKAGRKTRDALASTLADNGVMTKVYFDPVHLTEFYRAKFGFQEGMLPMTERLSQEVLTLPLFPTMKRHEMDYVIRTIEEFFDETLRGRRKTRR